MERFAFLLQCTKIAVEGVDLYPFAPIKKRHFGTIPLKVLELIFMEWFLKILDVSHEFKF